MEGCYSKGAGANGEQQSLKKCNKSDLPAGRKLIKHKWVFDIKRNGVFWARLVAMGCSQVPGLDCYFQFLPVVNDITFQIWLTCVLVWQLQTLGIDVEIAFLHGTFRPGEEVYMNRPPGMVHQTDECLFLLKTLCGLIQAARHYFNFFSKILIEIGLINDKSLPKFDRKQGTKYSEQYLKEKLSYSNVSPKE